MTKEEAKNLSDVLKAYSEGKEIEVMYETDKWIGIPPVENFKLSPMYYRVKPEPKYRPYVNAYQFIRASKEKGLYIKFKNGEYIIPERVTDTAIHYVTSCLNMLERSTAQTMNVMSFKTLVKDCTWMDNTPCGILEE